MLSMIKRQEQELAVVLFDIDNFKKINDTLGHSVGDLVIKKVAKIINETGRESDRTFRYGGEEFLLLLPNTSVEGAKTLAEKILKKVENAGGNDKHINNCFTLSAGIAMASEDASNIEKTLILADNAMYQAKNMGKNQVVISQL